MLFFLVENYIIYVCHLGLDPTRKLSYLDAAWESEWVEAGKDRMKEIVSFFSSVVPLLILEKFLKYRAKYVSTSPAKSSQLEKSSKSSMPTFIFVV